MSEVLSKLGYRALTGENRKRVAKRLEELGIFCSHFTGHYKHIRRYIPDEEVFKKDSTVSQSALRKRFIKKNLVPYKCAICRLPALWMGKELILNLDHINGENTDNELTNLRWVCPNCDRQLPTNGRKNNKQLRKNEIHRHTEYREPSNLIKTPKKPKEQKRPEKELLLEIIQKHQGNFVEVAKIFNASDSMVHRWCKHYNLPSSSFAYKENKAKQEREREKHPNLPIPVRQVNKDTKEVIAHYSSIYEAEHITGIKDIGRRVSGKRKTVCGYIWEKDN